MNMLCGGFEREQWGKLREFCGFVGARARAARLGGWGWRRCVRAERAFPVPWAGCQGESALERGTEGQSA